MKNFNKLFIGIIFGIIITIIGVNLFLVAKYTGDEGRTYLVELNRAINEIETLQQDDISNKSENNNLNDTELNKLEINNSTEVESEKTGDIEIDISKYTYIKNVSICKSESDIVLTSKYDYCLRVIDGNIYRFEYVVENDNNIDAILIINVIMILASIVIIAILVYIRYRIIVPFHKFEQVPYELSKGNLSIPLEERQTKYFGKFIWGTNVLRENLKQRREKELNMHKEKKTLLLSLAHDIKTPLSVIKLNAQATQRNVYKDKEKLEEVTDSIIKKVDEIENYVSQIIAASKEDFLEFSVKEEEFYLKEVIGRISAYYKDKLSNLKTVFYIEEFDDCLLSGDSDRVIEVIQNVMENAIKYGDGRKISVSFDEEEDCKLISIRNTGNTLKKEEIIHVFDSFFRGSNVNNKPGSGLGLYIARRLMTMMNGDIYVNSSGEDFVVTIVIRMV